MLYHLGVTANYTGFFRTAYALQLCLERPNRLSLVTKWLYPDVAKRYGTTWKAVERNIRTVISVIWKKRRTLLECLANESSTKKPCIAQFLSIVTASLLCGRAQAILKFEPTAYHDPGMAIWCLPGKIGESGMEKKAAWHYQAVEESCYDPGIGQYLTYGLQARQKAKAGWEQIEFIHDVTTQHRFAERLAELFNRHQLSPLHFRDTIEDMLP